MEEYFVHLEKKARMGDFESYLGSRNIEYKVFELKEKYIFHLTLEKDILKEMSKLEYIALVEPVNPVKMLSADNSTK